jgi:hypothetical protein
MAIPVHRLDSWDEMNCCPLSCFTGVTVHNEPWPVLGLLPIGPDSVASFPAREPSWRSYRMSSLFLHVAAHLSLGRLFHCCISGAADVFSRPSSVLFRVPCATLSLPGPWRPCPLRHVTRRRRVIPLRTEASFFRDPRSPCVRFSAASYG